MEYSHETYGVFIFMEMLYVGAMLKLRNKNVYVYATAACVLLLALSHCIYFVAYMLQRSEWFGPQSIVIYAVLATLVYWVMFHLERWISDKCMQGLSQILWGFLLLTGIAIGNTLYDGNYHILL